MRTSLLIPSLLQFPVSDRFWLSLVPHLSQFIYFHTTQMSRQSLSFVSPKWPQNKYFPGFTKELRLTSRISLNTLQNEISKRIFWHTFLKVFLLCIILGNLICFFSSLVLYTKLYRDISLPQDHIRYHYHIFSSATSSFSSFPQRLHFLLSS